MTSAMFGSSTLRRLFCRFRGVSFLWRMFRRSGFQFADKNMRACMVSPLCDGTIGSDKAPVVTLWSGTVRDNVYPGRVLTAQGGIDAPFDTVARSRRLVRPHDDARRRRPGTIAAVDSVARGAGGPASASGGPAMGPHPPAPPPAPHARGE